jgi:hypothetical protein
MGVRTTAELVGAIIEVDEDIPLDPFIGFASTLTDRVERAAELATLLTDDPESDGKTRAEKLQQIETLLAAHFYTLRDPRAVQEKAGSVAATYQSAVTFKLFTSHYGQHAMLLDETGTLEAINAGNKTRTVGVTWLGKTPEEAAEA